MDRRIFLTGTMGSLILAARPAEMFAQRDAAPRSGRWDAGQLHHLVPTVSDTEILLKASFTRPLTAAPTLRVGSSMVRGQMSGRTPAVEGVRSRSVLLEMGKERIEI